MPLAWRALFIALTVPLLASGNAAGLERRALQSVLDRVLDEDPTSRRTTVALKVVDLATGEVLYDRHGARLFTPASNLKIYTSACALDLFGPEHQFPTRVVARVDEASRTIDGDVLLVGGGNAMLSSHALARLADQIVSQWGVQTLLGSVEIDNTRYSRDRLGPGWMWDDEPYYFNMQITPLMVDFNVLQVRAMADSEGEITAQLNPVATYPPLRIVEQRNSNPAAKAWRVVRQPEDEHIIVTGAGDFGEPIEARVAVKDPAVWQSSVFAAMLRARGVKIEPVGPDAAPSTAAKEKSLVYAGPALSATLKHFNYESENAVGEVLLHEIALAHGKQAPTWSDGAEVITAWLRDVAGLEAGSYRLVDGSGLSRYNLISADSSVKLLAFMDRHRHATTFLESLPPYEVATDDPQKLPLVHAKSGGMSGVSTISGYLQTLEGRRLAFSLLSNGFIGSSKPLQALRGKVWRELIRFQAPAAN